MIGSAEHPDLAVIEVSDDLPMKLALAGTSSLGSSEPLVVLGYPAPAHAFKASAGRIVNFQGTDANPREAALTNVPINAGNSGGPGLRWDVSVAGVVTLMRLQSGADRVAIMYTAGTVRPLIDRFIDKPVKVLSTCGLGPDYVPRVPKTYEIDEAPATAPPVEELPPVQTTPKPRVPIATPVRSVANVATEEPEPRRTATAATDMPCPDGTVSTRVDDVSSSEKPEQPGTWVVRVRGTVTNDTTSDVRVSRIYVHVDGEPPANLSTEPRTPVLSEGGSSPWEPPEFEVRADERPTEASAFASWEWNDPELAHCASD